MQLFTTIRQATRQLIFASLMLLTSHAIQAQSSEIDLNLEIDDFISAMFHADRDSHTYWIQQYLQYQLSNSQTQEGVAPLSYEQFMQRYRQRLDMLAVKLQKLKEKDAAQSGVTAHSQVALSVPAPPNDNISNAISLAPNGGTLAYDLTGATLEANETSSLGDASLWYRWVAPSNDPVWFHTFDTPGGANVNTKLTISATQTVTSYDYESSYANGVDKSYITFVPVAGTTYYIGVGAYSWYDPQANLTWGPATTHTISGNLSAPSGGSFISGELSAYIYLCADADCRGRTYGSQYVTGLTPANRSNQYSIDVFPFGLPDKLYVAYSCNSCSDFSTLLPRANYHTDSLPSTTSWLQATPLAPGEDHQDINLTMLLAHTFAGTLNTETPPTTGVSVQAFVVDETTNTVFNGYSHYLYSSNPTRTYEIMLPADMPADYPAGYRISPYTYATGNSYRKNFYPLGFAFVGAPPTTPHQDNAIDFPKGQDLSGTVLTVLDGTEISGTVSLPDSKLAEKTMTIFILTDTASGAGIRPDASYIDTYGEKINYFGEEFDLTEFNYQQVTIPVGTNSVAYSMKISPDASSQWRVYYLCQDCGGSYEPMGYHVSDTETSASTGLAKSLPGGTVAANVNLILLEDKTICIPLKAANGSIATICL